MSRNRRLARERRDRRKFERAVAEMGAQLRHVRDGRLYEAAGYSTLEEWASAKFPTAWQMTPVQVQQMIAAALELADKREAGRR